MRMDKRTISDEIDCWQHFIHSLYGCATTNRFIAKEIYPINTFLGIHNDAYIIGSIVMLMKQSHKHIVFDDS